MKERLVAMAVAVVVGWACVPGAAAQQVAGIFGRGSAQYFFTGGSGSAFDESYVVLGLGLSYYPVDGLGIGLSFESWSGSDPSITKVTPSVQYVFYQARGVKPYIGAFYRRTYIEDLPDLDSAGGRAGVYFEAGRRAYFGIGGVYESYLDCRSSIYRECNSTYGELSFTVGF